MSNYQGYVSIELQLSQGAWLNRNIFGAPTFPSIRSNRKSDSLHDFSQLVFHDNTNVEAHYLNRPTNLVTDSSEVGTSDHELSEKAAQKATHSQALNRVPPSSLTFDRSNLQKQAAFEGEDKTHGPKYALEESLEKQTQEVAGRPNYKVVIARAGLQESFITDRDTCTSRQGDGGVDFLDKSTDEHDWEILMTSDSPKSSTSEKQTTKAPARHRPLVVGLRKPASLTNIMASSDQAAALNREIEQNVASNTQTAAPAEGGAPAESAQAKQKKDKAPKQAKAPKAAPAAAPTSPALIDLRVGHILRAIAHPNADSLYVSTVAMGDAEGTEHTHTDESTGQVVRTVCSGLNGLIPLAEMQDRKVVVVANLKPVNMRSIKSAAMVLAASPKPEEGADAHAPDRLVELVIPPADSAAGDKVYFEGWPYGDGRGPEKTLNPKKKQWEAIQPGFYTDDDRVVGFDASKCDEVSGSDKGKLIVEGKGACVVKTLKGAAVR